MPFGEWMDYWYQTYCKNTLKEYTLITYEERIYKQIIPKIGDTPLNRVTAGTLEKFYAHLKANGRLIRRELYAPGLANSVISSIHAHCRAALEKARAEGLIRQNPGVNCKLPPKKSPEIEILTPEEMQRLLIQAKEEDFYEMFLLDLSTGLRRGELLGLQWKDIDFERGTLSVNKQIKYINRELRIMPPKTQAFNRTVILPPQLLNVLREYKEKVNSIWLFPSPYKSEDVPREPASPPKPPRTKFEPHKGKYRKRGTGSIHQVSKNVWEGRYSPIIDGKRVARNVYADSVEECEEKLSELIEDMKQEFGMI